MIGEGRGQRIDLELGRAQLRLRLDSDQRYTNGLNTRLDDPPPAVAAALPEDVLTKLQRGRFRWPPGRGGLAS